MSYGYVHRRRGTSPGVEEPQLADQVQCDLASLQALPLASGEPQQDEGYQYFSWQPSVACERAVIPAGFLAGVTYLDIVLVGPLPASSGLLFLRIEGEGGVRVTLGASRNGGGIDGEPREYVVPAGGAREIVVRFDGYGQSFSVFDPAAEAPCVLYGGQIRLDIGGNWGTLPDALPAQVMTAHGSILPGGNAQAYGCRWRTLDARPPGYFAHFPQMIPGVHYLPSEGSIQFGAGQGGTIGGLEVPILYPVADDIDLSGGLHLDVTGMRVLDFELFDFDNAVQQMAPDTRHFSMDVVFDRSMEVGGSEADAFVQRAFVRWGLSHNDSRLGLPNVCHGERTASSGSFRFHNQIVIQHFRPRANLGELAGKMALLVVHRLPANRPLPVHYAYGYYDELAPQEIEAAPRWTSLPDENGEHSFAVKFGLVDGEVTVLQMTSDITLIDDTEEQE